MSAPTPNVVDVTRGVVLVCVGAVTLIAVGVVVWRVGLAVADLVIPPTIKPPMAILERVRVPAPAPCGCKGKAREAEYLADRVERLAAQVAALEPKPG